jgi:OmpA-OmpF porin, OOP family
MANVLYDIPLSSRFALSLGGGIGADNVSFDDGAGVDDDSWGFAYQGIVGLSYAVGRSTEVTLNYRYLVADGGSFSGGPLPATYHSDDFENHAVTIGLRFDLAPDEVPPPPAPPPPPPPPAPRQFIVFFGFNKANLTEEAQRVVAEAAQAAKDTGSASIIVVGHTDTVGSAAYNQKLSERRAGSVREALVALGINGGMISASGRGKTELLVQTGDGVKEPQNRRATIDLDGPST